MKNFKNNNGFTLIELVVVIVIISVLSLVAVQNFANRTERKRAEETRNEMTAIRNALVGDEDKIQNGFRVDYGYVGDVGSVPTALADLADASIANGPYISSNFQQDPDDWMTDAWGVTYSWNSSTLILTSDGALTNTGQSLTMEVATNSLTSNNLTVLISDRDGASPASTDLADIKVWITQQWGQVDTVAVQSDGTARFTGLSIGNHTVSAFHVDLGENLIKYVSIEPDGSEDFLILTFSSLPIS